MAKNDLLEGLLDPFRQEEDEYAYTAAILSGDKDAHKVLSTWSTMHFPWNKPTTPQPDEKCALWDWIWVGVKIDWFLFSERSGLGVMFVRKIFESLRANRLLYPDGTIPGHSAGALKAEFLRSLKSERG